MKHYLTWFGVGVLIGCAMYIALIIRNKYEDTFLVDLATKVVMNVRDFYITYIFDHDHTLVTEKLITQDEYNELLNVCALVVESAKSDMISIKQVVYNKFYSSNQVKMNKVLFRHSIMHVCRKVDTEAYMLMAAVMKCMLFKFDRTKLDTESLAKVLEAGAEDGKRIIDQFLSSRNIKVEGRADIE